MGHAPLVNILGESDDRQHSWDDSTDQLDACEPDLSFCEFFFDRASDCYMDSPRLDLVYDVPLGDWDTVPQRSPWRGL